MSHGAVAAIARLLARDGLVEAFGHVSARVPGGFLMTPTTPPLAAARSGDVLALDGDGRVIAGDPAARPLEAPLHAAIYRARPDVGAICRTHSPHAAAWAARGELPPLCHGLGMLAGELALHDGFDLVADEAAGAAAVRDLGAADCLLLRANGAVATAATLERAAVRAHYLEERAAIATASGTARPLARDEMSRRGRHVEAEAARAWRWLALRHGDQDLQPDSPSSWEDGDGSATTSTSAPAERTMSKPLDRRHG